MKSLVKRNSERFYDRKVEKRGRKKRSKWLLLFIYQYASCVGPVKLLKRNEHNGFNTSFNKGIAVDRTAPRFAFVPTSNVTTTGA